MGFLDGSIITRSRKPLTFASWDDYVGTGHVDPAWNGMAHDLTRGFLRAKFLGDGNSAGRRELAEGE